MSLFDELEHHFRRKDLRQALVEVSREPTWEPPRADEA